MPLVQPCSHGACRTLTMGAYCIEHEPGAGTAEPAPASRRFAALAGLAAVAGLAAALLVRARPAL